MEIELISPADREHLVASVTWQNEEWAEIIAEGGTVVLELYPRSGADAWSFDFDDAIEVLAQAKSRLLERLGSQWPVDRP